MVSELSVYGKRVISLWQTSYQFMVSELSAYGNRVISLWQTSYQLKVSVLSVYSKQVIYYKEIEKIKTLENLTLFVNNQI